MKTIILIKKMDVRGNLRGKINIDLLSNYVVETWGEKAQADRKVNGFLKICLVG